MKKSRENQLYRCSWLAKANGFELTCRSPVVVKVNASGIEKAKDKLIAKIIDLTGDGEPYLQFEPSLPTNAEKKNYFTPEYYEVGHNESVEWSKSSFPMFSDGECSKCGTGLGERTSTQRAIASSPKYDVAGFKWDKNLRYLYSESILRYLIPHVGDRLRQIPVDIKRQKSPNTANSYFELDFVPTATVAIPDPAESIGGWRCSKCKSSMIHFSAKHISTDSINCLRRLDAQGRVLLISKGAKRILVVDAAIREAIAKDRSLKGVVFERIAILDDSEVRTNLKSLKLASP